MDKQKMSWKEIFNLMHTARKQNNVIQFPTSENKEFKKQKNDLLVLSLKVEKLMDQPAWEFAPLTQADIENLAQFGEGLTFTPKTSQRLIACLCTELIKHRLDNMEDPY